jgi:hypothetical protein
MYLPLARLNRAMRRFEMSDAIGLLRGLYRCFNERDIDGVLASLAPDVAWANGMEGGHVHGPEAVRDYWTRQWAIVSPQVEPLSFDQAADGVVTVEVDQIVRDLEGRPLGEQAHGLKDKTVRHIFRFEGDKIARFDIGDPD